MSFLSLYNRPGVDVVNSSPGLSHHTAKSIAFHIVLLSKQGPHTAVRAHTSVPAPRVDGAESTTVFQPRFQPIIQVAASRRIDTGHLRSGSARSIAAAPLSLCPGITRVYPRQQAVQSPPIWSPQLMSEGIISHRDMFLVGGTAWQIAWCPPSCSPSTAAVSNRPPCSLLSVACAPGAAQQRRPTCCWPVIYLKRARVQMRQGTTHSQRLAAGWASPQRGLAVSGLILSGRSLSGRSLSGWRGAAGPQVWASKWNDRAWLSRRARGVPDSALFMAALIQQARPWNSWC